jgi:hypothetical protein
MTIRRRVPDSGSIRGRRISMAAGPFLIAAPEPGLQRNRLYRAALS